MKRRLIAALAALLVITLLVSCGDPGAFSDEECLSDDVKRSEDSTLTFHYADGAVESPLAYTNYIIGATGFALKQLRARAQAEKGSFVFSPAAVTLQLSMAANAASVDTRQEILLALGGTLTLDDLNTCSSYFKSRMESVSHLGQAEAPAEAVELDGTMLIDRSVDVKTAFLQTNANFYGYDIYRYDFKGEHAAEKLDRCLKPYTESSGIDVSQGGSLYTVTASGVTDSWLKAYSDADVSAGTFTGAEGERLASFLRSDEKKVHTAKATGVLKYTEKNPLKLLLVLPDSSLGLDGYLEQFDSNELRALLGSVDITETVTALIPEFSAESDGKGVSLADPLGKSGLYTLFTDKADFSSIGFSQTAKLGDMYEIPPTFSLTRSGINMGGVAASDAARPEVPADAVIFDRPFLFLLLDNETDIPVFAGVIQ